MKVYAVSALLLVAVAIVGAKNEELRKKYGDCVTSINWSKDQYNDACNDPGTADGPNRSSFLKMNTCIWLASEVLDSNGKIHPENAKNIVKPEKVDATTALFAKCDPKDDSMSVDAKAEALHKCYRSSDQMEYTRVCLALGQLIFQ